MDQWHANRDEKVKEAEVDTANFQEAIKETTGARRYGPAEQEIDKLIQLYIDLKEHPEAINRWWHRLSEEQQDMVRRSQSLSPELQQIAEQIIAKNKASGEAAVEAEVLRSAMDTYTMRLWNRPSEIKRAQGPAKFRTTTARAKPRTYDSILEGWAKGKTLAVEGATNAHFVARAEIAQTIEDRNLIKQGIKLKLISSQRGEGMEQIQHPHFTHWEYSGSVPFDPEADIEVGAWVRPTDRGNLGKVVEVREDEADVHFVNRKEGTEATKTFTLDELRGRVVLPRGRNFYINQDGEIFERRPLYADAELARRLNKILGTSTLSGPIAKAITKWNALLKKTVLFTNLFHHQAFLRSFMLGSRGINPVKAYRAGRKAIRNFIPELRDLVRGGLTFGEIRDWEEAAIQEQTAIGKVIDTVPMVGTVKKQLQELVRRQTDFLFKRLGAYLKVQAALLEYRHLLKRHETALENGEMSRHDLAKIAAKIINDDFGGLHLGRMERDPTKQHLFRLFALAPDWTESNIRSAVKAFDRGEEGRVYREFWGRIALRGGLSVIIFSMIMAAFDDRTFWERLQKAWKTGHLRWLDVDITPLYRALGGDDEKRKYFSLIGHFRDPLKFATHFVRSAKHKASILGRIVHDALTGVDWAGRRFTSVSELFGIDDKGLYKKTGLPKGGKLKGRLVSRQTARPWPVSWSQMPSYLMYEARGSTPIQVQNAIAFLNGEVDAFDAITKGMGLMTATTYLGEPREALWDAVEEGDARLARAAFERLVKDEADLDTPDALNVSRDLVLARMIHDVTGNDPVRRRGEPENVFQFRKDTEAAEDERIKKLLGMLEMDPGQMQRIYWAYLTKKYKTSDTRRKYFIRFNRVLARIGG